eukprot:2355306-Amphidinium_carterae.1
MVTLEQVQELVGRIQAVEAREADGITREQALQVQVQQLSAQLAGAQQSGGTAPGGGTQAPGVGVLDTRSLGKPEAFD